MATYRALVYTSPSTPLELQDLPRPSIATGTVLVRILATYIIPYMGEILSGKRGYPLAAPLVPGNSAIGRIEEVSDDTVSLSPGQLVFCDVMVRGRDDPDVQMVLGLHGGGYPAAQKLMDGPWRNSTFAELARLPLENVFALNEDVLIGRRGYRFTDLCWMSTCLIPYGGLSDIGVSPGETVIVAPATGKLGGAAVAVALAMGAAVIAAGRNQHVLRALESTYGDTGRFQTLTLQMDEEKDTEAIKTLTPDQKGPDAYIDLSPPEAAGSPHFTAALGALRPHGRVTLMGGIPGGVSIPYSPVMVKNIRIQGSFMYSRAQVLQLIRLLETGNLRLGKDVVSVVGPYGLDKIDEALAQSAAVPTWGSQVVVTP